MARGRYHRSSLPPEHQGRGLPERTGRIDLEMTCGRRATILLLVHPSTNYDARRAVPAAYAHYHSKIGVVGPGQRSDIGSKVWIDLLCVGQSQDPHEL